MSAGDDAKPTNPKDAIGSDKLPLHLWPTTASALGALALLDGALKYGRSNYRAVGIRPSIYYDAATRHLTAWFEGEDNDPQSGLPHLAHVLACVAIVVDAQAAGKMNDDRMLPINHRVYVDGLAPHVARLKALYAGRKAPKHYDINDAEALLAKYRAKYPDLLSHTTSIPATGPSDEDAAQAMNDFLSR